MLCVVWMREKQRITFRSKISDILLQIMEQWVCPDPQAKCQIKIGSSWWMCLALLLSREWVGRGDQGLKKDSLFLFLPPLWGRLSQPESELSSLSYIRAESIGWMERKQKRYCGGGSSTGSLGCTCQPVAPRSSFVPEASTSFLCKLWLTISALHCI